MALKSAGRKSSTARNSSTIARACFEALEGRRYFGVQWSNTTDVPGPADCDCSVDQSGQPVTYGNGTPIIQAVDLSSNSFGTPWGFDRDWVGVNNASQNGNGWMASDQPYLVILKNQLSGSHGGTISLVKSGSNNVQFDVSADGTTFVALGKIKDKLEYVPPTTQSSVKLPGYFKLTDPAGNITTFYDLPRASGSNVSDPVYGQDYGRISGGKGYAQQVTRQWFDTSGTRSDTADSAYRFGAFRGYTEASGKYTVTTQYDPTTGNLTNMLRTDGSGKYERLHYNYQDYSYRDAGHNIDTTVTQVSDVLLQKSSGVNGPWLTTQTAQYTYYDGTDENGRLGDLKRVAISKPAFESVDSITYSSTTATATIVGHGYQVNDLITIQGANQSVYNGTFAVTYVSGNTLRYTLPTTPSSNASGKIQANKPLQISSLTHSGATATATISGHSYQVGDLITIHGASPAIYNGTFEVDSVAGSNLTYTLNRTPATNASASLVATGQQVVTSLTNSGSTATATITGHRYRAGDLITIRGASPSAYNGTFTVASVSTNTLTYAIGSTPASNASVTGDAILATMEQAVSSISHSGATATATITGHGYQIGDKITIGGSSADLDGYNGTFTVASVATNTLTFTLAATPAANAGAMMVTDAHQLTDQTYYRYYKFHGYNFYADPGHGGYVADVHAITSDGFDRSGGTDVVFPQTYTDYNLSDSQLDNAVFSGLKSVVHGDAFTRLAANYSSFDALADVDTDYGTDANGDGDPTNDQLKSYANNFFKYQRYKASTFENTYTTAPAARYRVLSEVASDSGCSTCSGGFGTSKFVTVGNNQHKADTYYYNSGYVPYVSPNKWVSKTTEYLPDTTNYLDAATGALMEAYTTVTIPWTSNPFDPGDSVVISSASGFNGTYSIATSETNSFTVVVEGGFASGVSGASVEVTHGEDSPVTHTGVTLSVATVMVRLYLAGTSPGDHLKVTSAANSSFNGEYVVNYSSFGYLEAYHTAASMPASTTGTITNYDRISDDSWEDNDRQIVYSNQLGQSMLKILVDGQGTTNELDDKVLSQTYYHYDDAGNQDYIVHPSALAPYDLQNPNSWEYRRDSHFQYTSDLVGWGQSDSKILPNTGLIEHFQYATNTSYDIDKTNSGSVKGYLESYSVRQGFNGTDVPVFSQEYYRHRYDNYRAVGTGELTSAVVGPDTIATVVWPNSGLAVGDQIVVSGANQSPYNGTFTITATSSSGFSFKLSTTTAATATGTILVTDLGRRALTSGQLTAVNTEVWVPWAGTAYRVGQSITVTGSAGGSPFHGSFTITSVGADGFAFRIGSATTTSPSGTLTVSVAHNETGGSAITVAKTFGAGVWKAATVAQVAWPYTQFVKGDELVIAGASQSAYNGSFVVNAVNAGGSGYAQFVLGAVASATTATGTITVAELTKNDSVFPVASKKQYQDGVTEPVTTRTYSWRTDNSGVETNQILSETITLPAVTHNGSGSTTSTTTYFDAQGRVVWSKDAGGFLTYTEYDPITGGIAKRIVDVDTVGHSSDVSGLPGGWATPAGGGLHLKSLREFDSQGRTTMFTDPKGNITYTVYNDANHEIRVYRGWTNNNTTGPIEVRRTYRPEAGASTVDQRKVYTERLKVLATPTLDASGRPTGAETINSSNIISLTRLITNDAGQVVETDAYFGIAGLTYASDTAHLGTASNNSGSGNYHATFTDYDGQGRLKRTQSPSGTITRTVYDPAGRPISTWVGTDDTPVTSGTFWSPTNTAGTNLLKVSENEYDFGFVGDGNLTEIRQFPGNGAAPRITAKGYDWRNRLVIEKQGVETTESTGTNRPVTYYTYDNLGRVLTTEKFDGDQYNSPESATIVDSGFESPTVSGDEYNPTSAWMLDHDVVVETHGGTKAAKLAPSSRITSSFYFTGTEGPFTVSFSGAENATGDQTVVVKVNGSQIGAPITISGDTWTSYETTGTTSLTSDSFHIVEIVSTSGNPVFIDNVTFIDEFDTPQSLLGNPDFESSMQKWHFGYASGITDTSPAPSGEQVMFLTDSSSYVSQTLPDWEAGEYSITFLAATSGATRSFEVYVDRETTPVGTFTPSSTSLTEYRTPPFRVTAGQHRIYFKRIGSGSEELYIDNVAAVQVRWPDLDVDGIPDKPSLDLKAKTSRAYDEMGRVYESKVYTVDPSDGSVDGDLVTSTWYDGRGNVIKTSAPGGLVTKQKYDGAGRRTKIYQTDGFDDSTWRDAATVNGDVTVTFVEYDWATTHLTYAVEFGGAYAGQNVPQMTRTKAFTPGALTVSTLREGGSGVNEIQLLSLDIPLASGNFTLTFDGQTTSSISIHTTTTEILQNRLDALSNISAGDHVLTQTEYRYDANGNVIFTATRDRAQDRINEHTETGELPGASIDPNAARIVGRHLFYNDSTLDGPYGGPNADDDLVIDSGVVALLPGGNSSISNVSHYAKGINGVMIDVENLAGTPTAKDFAIGFGNGENAYTWLNEATSITVRPGEGVNGSDRVTLIFANYENRNGWLSVVMKPSPETGLAAPDQFFFGNLAGDTDLSEVVDIDDYDALHGDLPFSTSGDPDTAVPFDFDVYVGNGDGFSINDFTSDGTAVIISQSSSYSYGYVYDEGLDDYVLQSDIPGDAQAVGNMSAVDLTNLGWVDGDGIAHLRLLVYGATPSMSGTISGPVGSRATSGGMADGDVDLNGYVNMDDFLAVKYTATYSNNLFDLQPPTLARTSYTESYYDAADRLIDTVNLGTNGGAPKLNPDSSAPAASDTALRTSYGYQSNLLQGIQIQGSPTGGTFTLTFNGQTTSGIAYNASAATVQSSLIALSNVGPSDVVVTNGGSSNTYVVEFMGAFPATAAGALSATSSLTGGSSPKIGFSRPTKMTDPRGKVSLMDTDLLGRTTRSIANFVDGSPAAADDQTTDYTYDGGSQVLTMTARLPSNAFQSTQYVYGVEREVTSLTRSSTTATATVASHGYKVGQVVTVRGATQAYNGNHTITAVTDDTFSFTVSGSPATPATTIDKITVSLSTGLEKSVSSIARSGSTATATSTAHGYSLGQQVTLNGADQPEYNGTFIITAVTTNTFKFTVAGTPASASGTVKVWASNLQSGDTMTTVRYPDKSSGAPSTSEQEAFSSNAAERLTYTDRNGSVHAYTYDVLGRMTADEITTVGSGVNGTVRMITYDYNTQGLIEKITSYNVSLIEVNQLQRVYNGLGQLTREYQAVSGAVNTGSTPYVEYTYSNTEGDTVNHSRLKSIKYPNGRIVRYEYGATGYVLGSDVNDSISRLSFLADDSSGSIGTYLEFYEYLGLNFIVNRVHPQPNVHQTLTRRLNEQNGDISGDQYIGLDRFGRVIDQRTVYSHYSDLDRYSYTYDRNGNVLTKENTLSTTNSEAYSYDDLNRLGSFDRGTLSGGSIGSPSRSLDWNLDATGNWDSIGGGLSQDRTHNAQNQITGGVGTTPAYDNNGNMTTNQSNYTLKYDAWNRLVEVKNGGTTLAAYAYDGNGRRVTQGSTKLYYSDQWQVLEERDSGGTARAQYVWSPVYIDAMVQRYADLNTDGDFSDTNEKLYALSDSNFNTTALVDTSGTVVERYQYDPYGAVTILDASWTSDSDQLSDVSWIYLHQGSRYDGAVSLYSSRLRDYDPYLGRALQVDPLGSPEGISRYQWELSNPIHRLDPSGMFSFEEALRAVLPRTPVSGSFGFTWVIPIAPPAVTIEPTVAVDVSGRLCWDGNDTKLQVDAQVSFSVSFGVGTSVGGNVYEPRGRGSKWRDVDSGRFAKKPDGWGGDGDTMFDFYNSERETCGDCEETGLSGSITIGARGFASAGWGPLSAGPMIDGNVTFAWNEDPVFSGSVGIAYGKGTGARAEGYVEIAGGGTLLFDI